MEEEDHRRIHDIGVIMMIHLHKPKLQSWSQVCRALETIKENRLARDIEKKFCKKVV